MMSALVSDPNPPERKCLFSKMILGYSTVHTSSPIRIFMQNFNLFGFKRNDCTIHTVFLWSKKKATKKVLKNSAGG